MMKKLFIFLTLFILCSFSAQQDSSYSVTFKPAEWQGYVVRMFEIRNYIDKSNLPHQDVLAITKSIDEFMVAITKQLDEQQKKNNDTSAHKKTTTGK